MLALFRENCVPSDWDGLDLPSGRRVEPTSSFMEGAMRLPRTREDFDEIRNIPYAVYFARPNAGTSIKHGRGLFLHRAAPL